jgi:hypothetical protein
VTSDRVSIADPVAWRNGLTTGLTNWWAPLVSLARGGTTLRDLAGASHGTLTGGATWVTGPGDFHAVSFDGTDGYVATTRLWTWPTGSVVALVRSRSGGSSSQFVANCNFDGSGVAMSLCIGSPVPVLNGFAFFNGDWRFSGITTDVRGDGLWHVVAGTYDGSTLGYYLDGRLDSSAAYSGSMPTTSPSALDIGRYGNDGAYAAIDVACVLAFQGRALADSDMAAIAKELWAGKPAMLRRQGRTQRARVKGFSTPSGTLATGLIGAWELDEASGNAIDSHGSEDGTDTNTVGSGPGQLEGSVARDFELGSAEYFSLGDSAALSTGAIDFSIYAEVWMESKPAAIMSIFCKEGFAASNTEYILRYNNSGDRFQFFTGGSNFRGVSANNLGSPKAGQWYSIVAKHDATNNLNYIRVNGGTENSATTSGDEPGDTASGAYIGATNVSGSVVRHWDGKIRRLRFWKKLLTTAEEDELYNSGFGVDYDDINPPVVPSGNRRRRAILCGSR